jgi:hypothetical protein
MRKAVATLVLSLVGCGQLALWAEDAPQPQPAPARSSKFRSPDDGWLDISGFLDEKYGFLPVVLPITEPAVGYGAAAGMAFISSPLGDAEAGHGRPDITMVGGLATENGSRGAVIGDVRYWLDDRLQTLAGLLYASVNLDFYGIGRDSSLFDHPLRYNLEPRGGTLQTKYRLGNSVLWAGLNYAYATTEVHFETRADNPNIPEFRSRSDVSGFTPSLTFDSRDNIFTPTRGSYLEANVGLFSSALGGDDEFQRASLLLMHFRPLCENLYLGLRGDFAASFGDTPFYLRPFVSLRGAPIMRYQGEDTADIEAELRWQFWNRWSVVGFVGGGGAWNNLERFENVQSLVTGGGGLRYEIARKYGIHAGLDVAAGPDNSAIYFQLGGAWARP